jgi:hypothetical protein
MLIASYAVVRQKIPKIGLVPTGLILLFDALSFPSDCSVEWEIGSRLPGGKDVNIIITILSNDDGAEVDSIIVPDLPKDLLAHYTDSNGGLCLQDEVLGTELKIRASHKATSYA